MKQLEFETSKGRFRVVDEKDYMVFHLMIAKNGFDCISLQEITEEKAREIVDEFLFNANDGSDYGDEKVYKDYVTDEIYLTNPIESLHSLLKSKGIHLFKNPHPRRYIMAMTDKGIVDTTEKLYLEAEQKTFYNPYIFKL